MQPHSRDPVELDLAGRAGHALVHILRHEREAVIHSVNAQKRAPRRGIKVDLELCIYRRCLPPVGQSARPPTISASLWLLT